MARPRAGAETGVRERGQASTRCAGRPRRRPRCPVRFRHAADQSQRGGLGQELPGDVAGPRAEGTPQPDLADAFHDGDQRGVGDADRADDQTDDRQQQEQLPQVAAHGVAEGFGVERRNRAQVLGWSGRRAGAASPATWEAAPSSVETSILARSSRGGPQVRSAVLLGTTTDRSRSGMRRTSSKTPITVNAWSPMANGGLGPQRGDGQARGRRGADHGHRLVVRVSSKASHPRPCTKCGAARTVSTPEDAATTGVCATARRCRPRERTGRSPPAEGGRFQCTPAASTPFTRAIHAVGVLGERQRDPVGVASARVLHGHLGRGEAVETGVDLRGSGTGETQYGDVAPTPDRAEGKRGGVRDGTRGTLQDARHRLGEQVPHREPRAVGAGPGDVGEDWVPRRRRLSTAHPPRGCGPRTARRRGW